MDLRTEVRRGVNELVFEGEQDASAFSDAEIDAFLLERAKLIARLAPSDRLTNLLVETGDPLSEGSIRLVGVDVGGVPAMRSTRRGQQLRSLDTKATAEAPVFVLEDAWFSVYGGEGAATVVAEPEAVGDIPGTFRDALVCGAQADCLASLSKVVMSQQQEVMFRRAIGMRSELTAGGDE